MLSGIYVGCSHGVSEQIVVSSDNEWFPEDTAWQSPTLSPKIPASWSDSYAHE